ncbi:EthD family reductase [Pseudactinotalea sp.]|uniref:EthD family reductase n=1 Tax=Pseudactinotalea sp. TaxID=1926260 RepID=UPI003B3AC8F6
MYKATIVYGHPTDPKEFDRHYREVHIPLAKGMPNLLAWTITWLERGLDGVEPDAYLIAELYCATREDLQAAFESDAGRAAAADVEVFATGGVSMSFGPVTDVLAAEAT